MCEKTLVNFKVKIIFLVKLIKIKIIFQQSVVSIYGPLGYGPSTLPLRHSAVDILNLILEYTANISVGNYQCNKILSLMLVIKQLTPENLFQKIHCLAQSNVLFLLGVIVLAQLGILLSIHFPQIPQGLSEAARVDLLLREEQRLRKKGVLTNKKLRYILKWL